MNWCFVIVNNKLAEIYFEKLKDGKIKFLGHCYVFKKEFSTKLEQRWIKKDTERFKFVYIKNGYKKVE